MESFVEVLNTPFLGKAMWLWAVFFAVVVVLLVLDLGVLHKSDREIGMRESLLLYSGYFSVGLLYGVCIWWEFGQSSAMDFYTGFIVEQSLSMDNVFVMAVMLTFFGVPRAYQHRVLFWGIIGVVVLRAIMIGLGAALVSRYEWVLYLFGAFLLFTGFKMLVKKKDSGEETPDCDSNPIVRFVRKRFRVTNELHGKHFFVRLPDAAGRLRMHATPLFLALIVIELSDLVFAVDSVPAVFAITQDPYIVYTSNILAILGLRSLYFALSALLYRFVYLQYALGLVLVFIGCKILLHMLDIKVPAAVSLLVTFGILAGSILLSLWKTRRGLDTGT